MSTAPHPGALARRLAPVADLVALVKPTIMMMALLTAAGAMSLAPGAIEPGRALWLIAGTALIVGSANTLNMYLERDIDCLMARTRRRPLPMHRLTPRTALVFGALQGALSLPVLARVNLVTAALGLIALVLYVGVYTPMKQRSHWATWIGAIPGAMPALMGWTAATGRIELGGLAVFGVLLFWQIPHFHAIALYRQRDYDAAGLKTFPPSTARSRRAATSSATSPSRSRSACRCGRSASPGCRTWSPPPCSAPPCWSRAPAGSGHRRVPGEARGGRARCSSRPSCTCRCCSPSW